jgi:hypothetical protein
VKLEIVCGCLQQPCLHTIKIGSQSERPYFVRRRLKLSKTCLRAHYCLFIVQLVLSYLLKYSWRLITWLQLMKQQFKDKNLPFDNMLCLFSGGMKAKNNKKWPEIFLNFQSLITKLSLITRLISLTGIYWISGEM